MLKLFTFWVLRVIIALIYLGRRLPKVVRYIKKINNFCFTMGGFIKMSLTLNLGKATVTGSQFKKNSEVVIGGKSYTLNGENSASVSLGDIGVVSLSDNFAILMYDFATSLFLSEITTGFPSNICL